MKIRSVLSFVLALPLALSAEDLPKAPIWKISDEDSTVYLAGSVHLLREKDFPIPSAFDQAYAASEELVFEVDMATMNSPSVVAEMRKLGTLPEGETLADHFGENTMKRLKSYLEERQMSPQFFETYRPGMVFLLISSFEAARLGAKPELGLETIYYEKSVEDGKPSRGLETMAFQLSCLERVEADKLEATINFFLDHLDEGENTLDRILAAWREGKAEKMAKTISEESSHYSEELVEVLLMERNRNWIPEIEKALASDRNVMFLVGSAHLVGEGSVVDLLREKGLVVTQLANEK